MTNTRIQVGICVPTIREVQILDFFRQWTPFWSNGDEPDIDITLFVHEDHPAKEFELRPPDGLRLFHTCHEDIDATLGSDGWIIPRRSGACRSFPMFLAWKHGCDYIITMDDDCFPMPGEGASFIRNHLAAFRQDRWFRTIGGVESRGVPYQHRGELPVLLNHGLWDGTPDLDGPTSLQQMRRPENVILRPRTEVVPPGMWFTLCAMNVCYHRDAIPIAYNLLMGLEQYGLDRFDDIWSGLFIKKIADHMGYYVCNGTPFVYHAKASNYFANLQKEALGIRLHEFLWQHVSETPLDGEQTLADSYRTLADWIGEFPPKGSGLDAQKDYFQQLSSAMKRWLILFNGRTS